MSTKRGNTFWALAIISILVGVPAAATVAEAWGWFPNPLGEWVIDSITGVEEDGVTGPVAKVSLDCIKRGEEATDPAATGYIWYDWDGDSMVDLGDYPDYGEIETKAASSGVISTSVKYPVGQDVWFQLHASGYQVMTVVREVPTPGAGWDGETVLTLSGSASMVHLDTSIAVTASAVGTAGAVTLDTSTDYNYTLNGVNPTVTFRITCATDDYGIGQAPYTDWSTGKEFHGTFFAFNVALTDKSAFTVGGDAFDYIGDDGTNAWYVWDISEIIFNDAALDTDGYLEISVNFQSISGPFEILLANVYDGLLGTSFAQFAFGTADGSETSLNFAA